MKSSHGVEVLKQLNFIYLSLFLKVTLLSNDFTTGKHALLRGIWWGARTVIFMKSTVPGTEQVPNN